jgi:hypothetical protein
LWCILMCFRTTHNAQFQNHLSSNSKMAIGTWWTNITFRGLNGMKVFMIYHGWEVTSQYGCGFASA